MKFYSRFGYSGLILTVHSPVFLSYDVAVIQWIASCHKNRMTTRVITLWRVDVTSLTTSMSTMRFRLEMLPILKAIKSHFKCFSCQNCSSRQ